MAYDFKKMTKDELKAILSGPELATMTVAELTRLRKAAKDAGLEDDKTKDTISIAINNRTCEDIQVSDKYTNKEKKLAKEYRDEYNNEIKLAAVKRKAKKDGNKYIFADLTKGEMDLLMASGVSFNDIVLENDETKKELIKGVVDSLDKNAKEREQTKARLEEEKNKYRAGVVNLNENEGNEGRTFVATPEMFAEAAKKNQNNAVVADGADNKAQEEEKKNNTTVAVVPVNGGNGNAGNGGNGNGGNGGNGNNTPQTSKSDKKEGFWKRTWNKIKKPLLWVAIGAATLLGINKQCSDKQADNQKQDLIETIDGRIRTVIPCDPCAGLDNVNARIDSLEQKIEDGKCRCGEKKPVRKKTVKKADPTIIKGDTVYVPGDTIKGEPVYVPGDTIKGETVYVPGDTVYVQNDKRIPIRLKKGHKSHNEYAEAASHSQTELEIAKRKIEENKKKTLDEQDETTATSTTTSTKRVAIKLNSGHKKVEDKGSSDNKDQAYNFYQNVLNGNQRS